MCIISENKFMFVMLVRFAAIETLVNLELLYFLPFHFELRNDNTIAFGGALESGRPQEEEKDWKSSSEQQGLVTRTVIMLVSSGWNSHNGVQQGPLLHQPRRSRQLLLLLNPCSTQQDNQVRPGP